MITRRARSVKRHDELSHFWGRRSANERWGVPRTVEDFPFLDSAQLVAVSGGFLVGVLCVGYKGYPRVVYGLLSAKSGASRLLLGHLQRISCQQCAFQQQRLEITFFLHFLPPGLELPDRVDLSDGEQLCTDIVDQ
ncbi:hypothetical protein BHE74_00015525 [Ensete ventricosum]|nr:hypothetical protein BHE74_00015525 [Ensete ventricosum]